MKDENKIIITPRKSQHYFDLNKDDHAKIDSIYALYKEIQSLAAASHDAEDARMQISNLYNRIGNQMQEFLRDEPNIHVYSFETPRALHAEASRLIAKLRDPHTAQMEFIYYIQRAYELLFNMLYNRREELRTNYLMVETDVANSATPNIAMHKIPDVDELLQESVMCVMLRGALLPSMIISKEIEEYTSNKHITPFALFSIQRNEESASKNVRYELDLNRSYFNLEECHGKDLIFADPMNATGNSFISVVEYLQSQNVQPKSIRLFNVISSFEGALHAVRRIENASVFTLWMDPALNEMYYILPGLGDAGDRINNIDEPNRKRDIIQLIADYGSSIANLYRSQVRQIEQTVLHKNI